MKSILAKENDGNVCIWWLSYVWIELAAEMSSVLNFKVGINVFLHFGLLMLFFCIFFCIFQRPPKPLLCFHWFNVALGSETRSLSAVWPPTSRRPPWLTPGVKAGRLWRTSSSTLRPRTADFTLESVKSQWTNRIGKTGKTSNVSPNILLEMWKRRSPSQVR